MRSPIQLRSISNRKVKFVMTTVVIVTLAACSPGFSPKFASQQRMLLPEQPTEIMSPTIDDPTPAQDPVYNIYRLVSATFGASPQKKEISARIEVKSTQGTEQVDLLGKIRPDGQATLIDIQPLEGGKSRLVAEAFCQDGASCKQIILNVIFKVGTRTLQKQFVSAALEQAVGGKIRSKSDAPNDPTRTQNAAERANSIHASVPRSAVIFAKPLAPASTNSMAPETTPNAAGTGHPVVGGGPVISTPQAAPAAPVDPNALNLNGDDDGESTDLDDQGEYVGAQPPDTVIDSLWVRPEAPAPPAVLPSIHPSPSTAAAKSPTPQAGSVAPVAPPAPVDENDDISNGPIVYHPPPGTIGSNVAAPSKPSSVAKAPSAAAPSTTHTEPPAQAAPVRSAPRTDQRETPQASDPRAKSGNPSAPAVATAREIPQAQDKTDVEKTLAPMLDLSHGGKAIGSYDSGRLMSAEPLEGPGVFHVLYPANGRQFGTGMMISLIKNATSMMPQWFPHQSVLIGDIAQEHGGNINNHAAHQNGLDIDIPYIGEQGFQNILVNGHVKENFDYSKTWQFLRLAHSQQLMLNGRQQSALSMVFVARPIKIGFCRWAKDNDLLKNPEDADILRRLFPWPGHENHFHVRLKCSPHYPSCQNRPDPAPGTGC